MLLETEQCKLNILYTKNVSLKICGICRAEVIVSEEMANFTKNTLIMS